MRFFLFWGAQYVPVVKTYFLLNVCANHRYACCLAMKSSSSSVQRNRKRNGGCLGGKMHAGLVTHLRLSVVRSFLPASYPFMSCHRVFEMSHVHGL